MTKEIIIDYSVSGECYDGGIMYDCPSCKKDSAFPHKANYCCNCGKKLKWIRGELYKEGKTRLGLTDDEANYIGMECNGYIYASTIALSTKEEFIEILKKIPHKARYTKEASERYGTKWKVYGNRNLFINRLLKKLGVKNFNISDNGVIY